jgi:DNA-binding transcriptional LysR family regulator
VDPAGPVDQVLIANRHADRNARAEAIPHSVGDNPSVALQRESPDAVEQAIGRNLDVGILYYECVKDAVETGEVAVLNIPELESKGESFIVYQKERPLSSYARAFLTLVRQWKEKNQPSKAAGTRPAKPIASRAVAPVGWALVSLLEVLL